jgi:hypothetical protein
MYGQARLTREGRTVTAKRRQQGLYYVTRSGLEIDLLDVDALEGIPYPEWPGLQAGAWWLSQELRRAEGRRVAVRDAAWNAGLHDAQGAMARRRLSADEIVNRPSGYHCEECLDFVPDGKTHQCQPELPAEVGP